MRVQQILKSKASADVFTVKPGALVSEAAAVLAENRIGGVVVSADGVTAQGILSERDIVRELARTGAGCLARQVSDFMTRDLVTATVEMRADEVLGLMTDGRFRHMPVVEDGRMIGLITLGDVVKARLSELAMEKNALEGMIMGH
ncbi:CBS domain-containing protein [Aestuariivita sp.]|jgi:CBS domain-containing protein|uniref:CBS domain-containing protein n=1 Tax=Aestuariivita sp. TaxID=1872407 RepID=UPI002172E430|nr:CBS domain-containing protein [Aestuariivita sp.]MCE8008078.1 CBS domain-containing protein [Aestuariivita sp.]